MSDPNGDDSVGGNGGSDGSGDDGGNGGVDDEWGLPAGERPPTADASTDEAADAGERTKASADPGDSAAGSRRESLEDALGAGDRSGLLPESGISRVLTILLLVVLVVALAAVVYLAVNPPQTADPYTEFYVLDDEGNASNYPTNLSTGETGHVLYGVANHEQQPVNYTFEAFWEDEPITTHEFGLDAGEEVVYVQAVTAPEEPGQYRLGFRLEGGTVPEGEYQTLRLWVTVQE